MGNFRITKLVVIGTLVVIGLTGCASWIVRTPKVILLPEERIFTVPAGQVIKVTLDNKPMEMTFPDDMKLVSPSVLVRQEQKLNNAMLDKVKAKKDKVATMGIIGSILTICAGVLGMFRKKIWPNIKISGEMK